MPVLGRTASRPAFKQPITSAIPTLILEGEYDPITPPANGVLAAQMLSNSTSLVFPGFGHGILFTGNQCAVNIVLAFQDYPEQRPDASCIASLGEPAFH